MCLAVPGRLIGRFESHGLQMGQFDFAGATREVCLEYLPDLEIGEYAVVHVGFAISKLDEASARQTLEELAQLGTASNPEHD